tara:strand:+ start:343 stop:714 length:372 start_codon:yes stop_codon:yes gene_type:complete
MKTSTKLKKLATNSYLVWVSNYYRERNPNKEIRTILFGDIFHVYSVEFNKEDNNFSIELLDHFSKEYGKDVKPVKGAKNLLIQNYEYGKKVVHEIRGGYKESDFDFKKSNLDTIIERALEKLI